MTTVDRTDPSAREIDQDQVPDMVTVPVHIEAPVRVQALPSQGLSITTIGLATYGAQGTKVLERDPRRRTATLIPLDGNIVVGPSQAEALAGTAGILPNLVPVPITASSELWAAQGAATGQARVTIIEELWTE